MGRRVHEGCVSEWRWLKNCARDILADAHKTGVAQEVVKQTSRATAGGITAEEARMILQVDASAPWGEVVKVCE